MPRKNSMIPKAPLARILLNAGAKRVSYQATVAFADMLAESAMKIASHAAKIAKHSGRKTVKASDIKLAASQ